MQEARATAKRFRFGRNGTHQLHWRARCQAVHDMRHRLAARIISSSSISSRTSTMETAKQTSSRRKVDDDHLQYFLSHKPPLDTPPPSLMRPHTRTASSSIKPDKSSNLPDKICVCVFDPSIPAPTSTPFRECTSLTHIPPGGHVFVTHIHTAIVQQQKPPASIDRWERLLLYLALGAPPC